MNQVQGYDIIQNDFYDSEKEGHLVEHKQTLSDKLRKRFRGAGETCARFLLKLGLTPNMVTIIGCAGHLGVFWAGWKGFFLLASLLLFVFSVLDFLDGMMAQLPERQREAVTMKYIEGVSHEEMQRRLGMTSTNVYATLSRAMNTLKSMIK